MAEKIFNHVFQILTLILMFLTLQFCSQLKCRTIQLTNANNASKTRQHQSSTNGQTTGEDLIKQQQTHENAEF